MKEWLMISKKKPWKTKLLYIKKRKIEYNSKEMYWNRQESGKRKDIWIKESDKISIKAFYHSTSFTITPYPLKKFKQASWNFIAWDMRLTLDLVRVWQDGGKDEKGR